MAGAPVYDRILNEFYGQIENLSADKPYMVGPGRQIDTHLLCQR